MARNLDNWLGLWISKNAVEGILRSLKRHCRCCRIVLADTDVESFNPHLSKNRLLLRGIYMSAIFLKRIAELEVQNCRLSNG